LKIEADGFDTFDEPAELVAAGTIAAGVGAT
jgi:hypothetical protein